MFDTIVIIYLFLTISMQPSEDVEMIDTASKPTQQPVAAGGDAQPQANPGDLHLPVEMKYFNLFDGYVQT